MSRMREFLNQFADSHLLKGISPFGMCPGNAKKTFEEMLVRKIAASFKASTQVVLKRLGE